MGREQPKPLAVCKSQDRAKCGEPRPPLAAAFVCVCAFGHRAFLEVAGRGQEAAGVTRKLQGELGGAKKHQDRRHQEAPGSARSSAVTPPEIFRGFILSVGGLTPDNTRMGFITFILSIWAAWPQI